MKRGVAAAMLGALALVGGFRDREDFPDYSKEFRRMRWVPANHPKPDCDEVAKLVTGVLMPAEFELPMRPRHTAPPSTRKSRKYNRAKDARRASRVRRVEEAEHVRTK